MLTLALLPISYVMPPVDVTGGHALPVAAAAAVAWVLLQVGFNYYAGSASRYAAYGLFGADLPFVTFRLGAIVLSVGVVLDVAFERWPDVVSPGDRGDGRSSHR